MQRQFKVVRMSGVGGSAVTPEEAAELTRMNAELVEANCVTEDEAIAAAKDADAIMMGRANITRRVMEALPKCRIVIFGSVGFDRIDIDAATDNGIVVVNNPSPEWCLEEVSNHAITLLLACAKKLCFLNNATKQGRWAEGRQRAQSPMPSIHGDTLGLVGCGSIGRLTGKKAQCFGLKLLGYDLYVDKATAKEAGITLVSLPELLKESDFVSLHTPLSDETRHLMGEKEFKQMKPTAYLINTSRGPVVDELALIKALQEKQLAGAGLDVFEKEPVAADNPLLGMDNVIATPHNATASNAVFNRSRVNLLQEAGRVFSGKWPKHAVNPTVKPKINLVKEA